MLERTRTYVAPIAASSAASNDLHSRLCRSARTGVVDPLEIQRSGVAGGDKEPKVRVGRDARAHAHREHRVSVVAAGKAADHIARNRLAAFVGAISGFHGVADRDANLDRFVATGCGGGAGGGGGPPAKAPPPPPPPPPGGGGRALAPPPGGGGGSCAPPPR